MVDIKKEPDWQPSNDVASHASHQTYAAYGVANGRLGLVTMSQGFHLVLVYYVGVSLGQVDQNPSGWNRDFKESSDNIVSQIWGYETLLQHA